MRLPELKKYWFVGSLSVALLTVSLLPDSAQAGDWDFRHRTAVGLTVVDRTGDNAQDGTVLQAIPQLYLNGEGGRIKANFNYRLTASAGSDGVDPRDFTHTGYGRVKGELIEDFFWLGADATAGLTGDNRNSGPVDAINFNSNNGRQTFTVAIKPEFRHHLNRYAEIVSLNSFDAVNYDADDETGSGNSSRTVLNISVRDGRYFSQFDWSLNATHRKTDYKNDRDDETRNLYDATLRRPLNANWAVFGRVGYEDNDLPNSTSSNNSGGIWDLGGSWNPSPRTRIKAEIGHRYFGNRYQADIRHQSRRTTLSAFVSRNIDNRRNEQLLDSYFFLTDSNGTPILDPNTGDPIIANSPQLSQTNDDFVNTQFRVAATVVGRRTQATLTGTVQNRDYQDSPRDEDWYGATLSVSRQLGGNYRATLGGTVRSSSYESGRDSSTYDANFLLAKDLSVLTTVAVDLLYRKNNDSAPGASYTEKRLGLWYRTSFL